MRSKGNGSREGGSWARESRGTRPGTGGWARESRQSWTGGLGHGQQVDWTRGSLRTSEGKKKEWAQGRGPRGGGRLRHGVESKKTCPEEQ